MAVGGDRGDRDLTLRLPGDATSDPAPERDVHGLARAATA